MRRPTAEPTFACHRSVDSPSTTNTSIAHPSGSATTYWILASGTLSNIVSATRSDKTSRWNMIFLFPLARAYRLLCHRAHRRRKYSSTHVRIINIVISYELRFSTPATHPSEPNRERGARADEAPQAMPVIRPPQQRDHQFDNGESADQW